MKFKLRSFFNGAIERVVMCTGSKPGTETNKRMTFLPDVTYSLTDPIACDYIRGNIGDNREKMVATASVKELLEFNHVPYTIKKCGTCSNAHPKAFFNPFEILEDENHE